MTKAKIILPQYDVNKKKYRNVVSFDLKLANFIQMKQEVEQAIRSRKTFMTCTSSDIRRLLKKRGWIEKIVVSRNYSDIYLQANKMSIQELLDQLDDPNYGAIYKRILLSKLLGSNPCDFIWDPRPIIMNSMSRLKKSVWMSHFRSLGKNDFCAKIGLYRHLSNLAWNYRENEVDVYYPRTYIMSNYEMDDFIYDYRITACVSLLKWSINRYKNKKPFSDQLGQVPVDVFFFALVQCLGFIKHKRDCDFKLQNSLATWQKFSDFYTKCVYHGEHFTSSKSIDVNDMIEQARATLRYLAVFNSDVDYDGTHNIWIMKPDLYNRGQGIQICRTLTQIREILSNHANTDYVVQKYIEKPFLIYNTKFDIRQWFFITTSYVSNPNHTFSVWFYNECYLRFSSQVYDITKCHESIHLTNNSVQHRYKINSMRHPKLPTNNMWDLKQFQAHLQLIGKGKVWTKVIYPKMKQAILAVIFSARSGIDRRPNTFELFGADFLLTSDFQPWLLEINRNPALSHSTSVTSRLCPQVLNDMLRVIIDGKNIFDGWHSNGQFELIYSENKNEKYVATGKMPADYILDTISLSTDRFKQLDKTLNKYTRAGSKKNNADGKISTDSDHEQIDDEQSSTIDEELFDSTNELSVYNKCLKKVERTLNVKIDVL